MTKPKVAPKTAVKKVAPKKVATKPAAVEMVSYSIKMVIPTGQYANVQPEIVVKSGSIEAAHDFIAPHMNKLWKEYYLINERRPEPAPAPAPLAPTPNHLVTKPFVPDTDSTSGIVPSDVGTATSTAPSGVTYLTDPQAPAKKPMTVEEIAKSVGGTIIDEIPEVQPPGSGVAFTKATQAIESCMSLDALEIIRVQIDKSTKLTQEDKETLQPLLLARLEHLGQIIQ